MRTLAEVYMIPQLVINEIAMNQMDSWRSRKKARLYAMTMRDDPLSDCAINVAIWARVYDTLVSDAAKMYAEANSV